MTPSLSQLVPDMVLGEGGEASGLLCNKANY